MTTWRPLTATALLALLVSVSVAWAAPASQPARQAKPARQTDATQVPATQPFFTPSVPLAQQVEAELRIWQPVYQTGQPVWIEFTLRNRTPDTLTLQVPNALVGQSGPPAMGLPLAHVFSGPNFVALEVTRQSDMNENMPVQRRPGGPVAPLVLAPYGSIGVHVDAAKWYPMLRQAGEYKLHWKPYNGQLTSNTVTIKIAAYKDAVIRTEYGNMRMKLSYDKAPKSVESFLELVQRNFYDNLTFHRLVPGFILQGGSPTGDDTGTRPDGGRLKAEFSNVPFDRGTVAIARAANDTDSGSCQFFICLARQPELDGQYTVFGQLIGNESFETLAKLEQVEITRNGFGEMSQPAKPLRIQGITLENAPRPPSRITPTGAQAVSPGLASSN